MAVVRGWWTLPVWLAGALVCWPPVAMPPASTLRGIGIGLDAVHLACRRALGRRDRCARLVRPPGGWRSSRRGLCSRRFTPVALGGVRRDGGRRRARGDRRSSDRCRRSFGTAYGRVLLVKMALVALMLPLSVMAWRLERPHVRIEAAHRGRAWWPRPPCSRPFRRHPARPRGRRPKHAAATPTRGASLAGDELTMAGPAGSVLVG